MGRIWEVSELRALVAGAFFSAGCSGPTDARPRDVTGTMASAARLTFGAEASIRGNSTTVELCLTPDGLCVPADFRVDECFRYDDIHAFVDGVEIPVAWPGGWSQAQRFEPLPTGGGGYGCSYPLFETTDLGVNGRTGTQEITIRIGSESTSIQVVNWLEDLQLAVPETLVKGTDVVIGMEPIHGTEAEGATGSGFIFHDLDTESPDKFYAFEDVGSGAWSSEGFLLSLPASMPTGPGVFHFASSSIEVGVDGCPFDGCDVRVGRVKDVDGITVVEP